jgi:RNA polymerase sigma factor (sigma-70 family)
MEEPDRSSPDLPPELRRLFAATGDEMGEAWAAFIASHSRLLLHVARELTPNRDAALDAYTFMLDRLREGDCRRLTGYAVRPGAKFTTWLVVVARRLTLDWHRQRYGRARHECSNDTHERRLVRRRIEDLVVRSDADGSVRMQPDDECDQHGADARLRADELRGALDAALATLAPADRLLLKLRYEDQSSVPEIARLLRYPSPFHVYRRISSLLDGLRRVLRARGVESPAP